MAERVLMMLGTGKGVFFMQSDAARRDWRLSGPFCDTWPINHVKRDPASGAVYAVGGSPWHGVDVWKTSDLGESWTRSGDGLAHDEDSGEKIDSVWSLGFSGGKIYAGVKPAALFESADGGRTWALVEGLSNHPSRKEWMAGGAGLTLHHIVTDPANPARLWVGISAAGVFHSADGGGGWEPRNVGVRLDYAENPPENPIVGNCVHGLALAAGGGEVMYQQNHCGMYRSDDGGRRWRSIEAGLPSSFGFPVAAHPRDADAAWFVPMNGDMKGRYAPDARPAVWRTRDGGASWSDLRDGLPQEHCYFTVLRQALAADPLDPVGVYFGTNSGSLYASADEGDHWRCLARDLPLINSVEVAILDG